MGSTQSTWGVSPVTPAHTDPTQPQHGRRRHRQEDLRHLRLGWQGRARPLLPGRHHVRHGLQHHQEGVRRPWPDRLGGQEVRQVRRRRLQGRGGPEDPDSQGTYADYVELLKLYDKNQNGTMMLAELDNILCNLGDEIPKEDVQKMFAEICDPEDEDGLFPYMSFLDRLTGKA